MGDRESCGLERVRVSLARSKDRSVITDGREHIPRAMTRRI